MKQETLSIFVCETFIVQASYKLGVYEVVESVSFLPDVESLLSKMVKSLSICSRPPTSFLQSFIGRKITPVMGVFFVENKLEKMIY